MTAAPSKRRGLQIAALVALFVAGALFGVAGLLLVNEHRIAPEPKPGAVDIGFAQDMAQHHQQALEMSQLALTHDSGPAVQAFARQITLSQAKEQGTLQGWLTLWEAPQLPSGPPMTWMQSMHAMGHHVPSTMPGMATPAQLERLDRLQGAAFDEDFLRLMTRHHQGGVAMAGYAREHARLPEVRALAAEMVVEQTKEIATFRQLQAAAAG